MNPFKMGGPIFHSRESFNLTEQNLSYQQLCTDSENESNVDLFLWEIEFLFQTCTIA